MHQVAHPGMTKAKMEETIMSTTTQAPKQIDPRRCMRKRWGGGRVMGG
jgi:hypothetical protein